jgi:hypothetical protein
VTADDTFTFEQDDDDDSDAEGEVACSFSPLIIPPVTRPEDSEAIASAAGTPQKYYFIDAFNIGLLPPSSGFYPALFINYDAEVEDAVNFDTALPVPGYVESGLIAYAASMAGGLDKAEGMGLFEKTLMDWRAARNMRENVQRVEEAW